MVKRFPNKSDFQGDLSLFKLLPHLKTLPQTNARNTHVTEYLRLYALIQSTCPEVLTKLYWCWNKDLRIYPC